MKSGVERGGRREKRVWGREKVSPGRGRRRRRRGRFARKPRKNKEDRDEMGKEEKASAP